MAKKKENSPGRLAYMWSLETETRAGKRNYRSCIMLLVLLIAVTASSSVEVVVNGLLTWAGADTVETLSNLDIQVLFYLFLFSVVACPILLYYVDSQSQRSNSDRS